jgi:hypothetical protein
MTSTPSRVMSWHFSKSLSLRMKSLGLQRLSLHALGSSLQGIRDIPHQKCQVYVKTPPPPHALALGWCQALQDEVLASKGKFLGLL